MAASAAGYDPMSSLSAPMGGRAARLSFDPAQPETYSTFRLKLKALSSSTMADAAEMGKCPTYNMIASRMPDASEETVAEEAMRLIRQYEAASSELYRLLTLRVFLRTARPALAGGRLAAHAPGVAARQCQGGRSVGTHVELGGVGSAQDTYLTQIGLAWALCEPCPVVGVAREIPWECFSLMQHETITVCKPPQR